MDLLVADGPTAGLRGAFCEPYPAGMQCRVLGVPQREAPAFLRGMDIAFMNSRARSPARASTGTGTSPG
ncbi:hypothetical protein [Streptomyces naphthomycinicus]|uniref:hypothetical protein n=1 Tax=Streptomyces naphthomycinicus TaxID=2872625 RepID=UPI001CECF335|nr:hypothetical protein [Streptomyces sp. TML10]